MDGMNSEEKIQKQMEGHVVYKCKEDEFEGIGVTNFGFTEESLDTLGHEFVLKKTRVLRDLVLEFWSSIDSCWERS